MRRMSDVIGLALKVMRTARLLHTVQPLQVSHKHNQRFPLAHLFSEPLADTVNPRRRL